jgi:hypothetical protein
MRAHERSLRTSLLAVLVVALAVTTVWAGSSQQIAGRLSRGDSWVLRVRSTTTLDLDQGSITVNTGVVRRIFDRDPGATALIIEGEGLAPRAPYLLLVNQRPALGFTAGEDGRVLRRLAAGPAPADFTPLASSLATALTQPTVSVQVLGSGDGDAAGGILAPARDGDIRPTDPLYDDWTPLCGIDPVTVGSAMVHQDDVLALLTVSGEGLAPFEHYAVIANDIEVGTAQADDFGSLWFEAAAPADASATGVPLPGELLPVDVIATITVVSDGGEAVLAGDFSDPCEVPLPDPDQWGLIELCSDDEPDVFGFLEWVILDADLQAATLNAFGLTPAVEVEVSLDGVAVGSATVDQGGFLWLALSTDPGPGELPLPDEVLPLDGLSEVLVTHLGDVVLGGTAGQPCGPVGPPPPVAAGWTPLCPTSGDPTNPGMVFAEAGWEVFDDGLEHFWVNLLDATPDTPLEVVVDGFSLGTFTTDGGGFLVLLFASDGQPLPLPDEIRPVSAIDEVTVLAAGEVVLEGSFSEPCEPDPPPPPPPPPGLSAATLLCGDDSGMAFGETGWSMWDDGGEDFWVWGFGLQPDTTVELEVDGVVIGTFASGPVGEVFLNFSTSAGAGSPDVLPLPEAIRPVSEIEVVRLLVAGVEVLGGSFIEPCEPPQPPGPIAGEATILCPSGGADAWGEAAWTQWDDGSEGLFVQAMGLGPNASYELLVDGVSLGTHLSGPEGELFLDFASDPLWGGQLPLPDEVRPVSEIDVIEVVGVEGLVLSGSFSEPCDVPGPGGDGAATPLCDGMGMEAGFVDWWTIEDGDTVVDQGIEILVLLPPDPGTPPQSGVFTAEIDGVALGPLEGDPMGGLFLGLCGGCPQQVPDALLPVSGIDVVRILDGDGADVVSGSFSDPCVPGWKSRGRGLERSGAAAPLN